MYLAMLGLQIMTGLEKNTEISSYVNCRKIAAFLLQKCYYRVHGGKHIDYIVKLKGRKK